MTHILKHTGSNIGGINALNFAPDDDFESIDIDLSTLDATYSFIVGGGWRHLYGTPGSIVLKAKEEQTDAGTKYIYSFELLTPKDRKYVEKSLLLIKGQKLVIRAMNKNGTVRLFGTLESPMRVVSKLQWPASVEDYNGYKVVIQGEFSHPAGYLDDRTVPFPIPAGEQAEPMVDPLS